MLTSCEFQFVHSVFAFYLFKFRSLFNSAIAMRIEVLWICLFFPCHEGLDWEKIGERIFDKISKTTS